jgi:nitrogen regulatory protein PII
MTEANGSNRQLQEGVKLELIVSDRQVEKALSAILRNASPETTSQVGHVTLLDIGEVLQLTPPAASANPSTGFVR